MGKVRTEQIKRIAKELIERFPDRFSSSFEENKRVVNELLKGATTKVRNRVTGYVTRIYVSIQATSQAEGTSTKEA